MSEVARDLFGNPEQTEYPDAPGHRGVETSAEAAESIAPRCGRLQKLTLGAVASRGPFGLTADETAEVLGMDRWSIQPRRSELKRNGLILDSSLRRLNSTGKRAIVWVTPENMRKGAN